MKPPWTGQSTPLARAMRAGLARADLAAQHADNMAPDETPDDEPLSALAGHPATRGIVTGGFGFEVEELSTYARAMGEAYARALAEMLAARAAGRVDTIQLARITDQIAGGLDDAGAPGLFAGLFAQGVVTGELEHREQLKDEHRSSGDA